MEIKGCAGVSSDDQAHEQGDTTIFVTLPRKTTGRVQPSCQKLDEQEELLRLLVIPQNIIFDLLIPFRMIVAFLLTSLHLLNRSSSRFGWVTLPQPFLLEFGSNIRGTTKVLEFCDISITSSSIGSGTLEPSESGIL
jgi:hypothetical protein